jgi:hypothetical protein
MPDSLQWIDPPPPGIALQGANGPGFRIRVYYNKSVTITDVGEPRVGPSSANALVLSPNPAHNTVTIFSRGVHSTGTAVITDILGRPVRSNVSWNGTWQASLQNLIPGTYEVTVQEQLSVSHALLVVE